MNMSEWAKNEIEIACKRERGDKNPDEWDYGCACYESAYKAFQSLLEDGHSGYSIGITKWILNRLIDHKPLTPIEDTPDVWGMREERPWAEGGYTTYQCKRMSSLFKDVYQDGEVKYNDVNRFRSVNEDNPDVYWSNGFINRLMNEKYPITMPYIPEDKPYIVHCTEGLSDPKNGDFDTIGIWYVVKPDGTRDTIERFFKEGEESFVEISREEYEERVKPH